ncbi:MAG TPA: hypothetical protein VHS52_05535 [Acidimicrobiales bacterium]|jgi:hypothetical protein|nr:hypothetical protein [Acidimicrobiales bacterium]
MTLTTQTRYGAQHPLSRDAEVGSSTGREDPLASGGEKCRRRDAEGLLILAGVGVVVNDEVIAHHQATQLLIFAGSLQRT